MKVSDVMQKRVESVNPNASLLEVARIIFGYGINGVPVSKGKKLVGMITEQDILDKFHPSMQEYVEDYTHARDFEAMEENIGKILSLPAEKVMNKSVATVKPDTPLLKAEAMMKVREVGRLPVVDERGNLIGIVSKGDIFRTLVAGSIPYAEDEEYHDWLGGDYDIVIDWKTRLKNEIADLRRLFKKEGIKHILDIGCGTGEHGIALAKEGFNLMGLEKSRFMFSESQRKWKQLPRAIQEKLQFIHGEYTNVLKPIEGRFEACILMGNALPHNSHNYRKVVDAVRRALVPKKALIVLQIVNFEKLFKATKRFQDFNIAISKYAKEHERAFVEFYDPPRLRGGDNTLNMAMFDFDGRRWRFRAMNSTPIAPLGRERILSLLKSVGFSHVSFYGGRLLGPLFRERYEPLKHDWLNVVAKR